MFLLHGCGVLGTQVFAAYPEANPWRNRFVCIEDKQSSQIVSLLHQIQGFCLSHLSPNMSPAPNMANKTREFPRKALHGGLIPPDSRCSKTHQPALNGHHVARRLHQPPGAGLAKSARCAKCVGEWFGSGPGDGENQILGCHSWVVAGLLG